MESEYIKNGERAYVMHLVTGGGSGATRVAVDLALAEKAAGIFEPILLFRRKNNPLSEKIIQQVNQAGVKFHFIVNRWPKYRTISQIARLCHEYRPLVFVAHGNSEHIWGRRAAIAAGVPHIVHVEHNLEKYRPWRLWQARRLAERTDMTICVSTAVAEHAKRLGIAARNTMVVPNGSDVARYASAVLSPLRARSDNIVMAARFARQKDHATLVRAAKLLVDDGWTGSLILAGGGKSSHKKACEKLVAQLGLYGRVHFAGFVEDMPALLHLCRVSVLSSFYEGFGLALTEAMAANCVAVSSDVRGVHDVIKHGETGFLFPVGDAAALAGILKRALSSSDEVQRVADSGRDVALSYFTIKRMANDYDRFFMQLVGASHQAAWDLRLQHV